MGTSQYPRLGYPLAPRCLREVLDIPIPLSLAARALPARLKYFELDEKSWTHFPARRCKELGKVIVQQTSEQIRSLPRKVLSRHLPAIPAGIEVDDLDLEPRTRNRLQQMMSNARLASLDELQNLTVGQILCTDGLGAKCLVDLLTSLEGMAVYRDQVNVQKDSGNHPAPKPLLEHRLSVEANRLKGMPDTVLIRLDDPRLGKYLREAFRFAASIENERKLTSQDTLVDLAIRIASRPYDPANPLAFSGHIRTLRRNVALMSRLPLEKELRGITTAVKNQRAADIFLHYQGWSGDSKSTLRAAAAEFGITHGAVSWVCADFTEVFAKKAPYLPSLDKTLAFVKDRLPAAVCDIELALTKHGLTEKTFSLESLLGAARFFNRQPSFAIETSIGARIAVPKGRAGVAREITRVAEREITKYGAATMGNVTEQARGKTSFSISQEFASRVLQCRRDFQWLSREGNWFWLSAVQRNPLVNSIRKILSVSPRIDVHEVRTGISRNSRPDGAFLPCGALLELCRLLPMCNVMGEMVFASETLDPQDTLCDSEQLMLRILRERGPLLKWGIYQTLCLNAGMNKNMFNSVIRESPIVAKHAPGIYTIIGTHVLASPMVASVSESREPTNMVRVGVAEDRIMDC
jgi:hypothetical protein